MKRTRQARIEACRDFLRLAQAHDLLSRAGAVLMRTSPKATVWTAGIAVSGRLASILGLPGFTRWQALTAPVVVGGGLLGLGLALRYVPRILSGRLTTVAEANDLNLMEDYRKSQALEHLNILWDRVFWYESALRYNAEERQAERMQMRALRERVGAAIDGWDSTIRHQLGVRSNRDRDDVVAAVLSERPLSDNLEKSREGFLVSALYALRHALPQSSEAYEIGFRLSLYEDFCDGAYFDPSDTKLAEQYAGNVSLTQIKRQVGFGRLDALRQAPRQLSARLWFYLITRKIALGAGRAVQALNDAHQTDTFNSQVLLWPGEEDAPWLRRFDGARDDVIKWRRCIVTATLGSDYERASAVLGRALSPGFEFATELRARFDPEYVTGGLDYVSEDSQAPVTSSLLSDLEALGCRARDIDRARAYVDKVKHEQAAFAQHLSERHQRFARNAPALRAVKIAFHIDQNRLKRLFQSPRREANRAQIDREIEHAVATETTYSSHLMALRLHHQLALIHLNAYQALARALAYA